jgi:D-amino peptidase
MERELPQLAILDRSYDAVLAVGVHDQTPSNNSARAGLLAHTWLPGWRWSVNGEEVSEALLNAYTMGEMGIPLIFASGDDVIADGLMSFYSKRDLPITTVTVKKALGLQSAAIPALEASYADVASGVASAVRRFVRARPGPLLPPSPVDLRIWPGDCDRGRIASIPNQETSGEGWIRVRAQSFAAAIRTGAEILNTFYPDALRVMEEQARQLKYSYLQRRVLGGAP